VRLSVGLEGISTLTAAFEEGLREAYGVHAKPANANPVVHEPEAALV